MTLFERGPRRVSLTDAGKALLGAAEETLAASNRVVQLARSLGRPLTGPLRLGTIPTVGPYLLPRVLPALDAAFPDLHLFLREDTTARLLVQLESGDLDLLLLAIDVELGDLTTLPLFSDPFVLAFSAKDPLVGKAEAQLADLEGRSILLLEDGHCLRDQTLSLCEASGGEERTGFRSSSLAMITQMVARGLGSTLLPELAVKREAAAVPGLATIPFGSDGPFRSVGLAWRARSPRGEEFERLGTTIAAAYMAD